MAMSALSLYAGGNFKGEDNLQQVVPVEEANYYLGVGIGAAGVTSFIYNTDVVANVTLKAGYDFSEYMGIELRASTGVTDGDNLGYDYSYGVYVKPQYSITQELKVYALLGYAKTKITLDPVVAAAAGVLPYTTQNGFSFGAGFDYQINKDWSVYVDATRLIDKSRVILGKRYDTTVDSVTFGVTYHF